MNNSKVYIADLAAYNNAILHGIWVDMAEDVKTIRLKIKSMLQKSPISGAEEIAIHDFEGFGSFHLNEFSSLEYVKEIANFLEEHGSLGSLVFSEIASSLSEATEFIEDKYAGEFKSCADFAESIFEETQNIPESLRNYIDYERLAHDMVLNGEIYEIEESFKKVHIFWAA